MEGYSEKDIDFLLSNREVFNSLVYTPFKEAVRKLRERWDDQALKDGVESFLNNDIPKPLRNGSAAVLFRQIATPNYEIRRFLSVPDALDLHPVFWEYLDDKFLSINPLKRSLAKIPFHKGYGKNNHPIVEYRTIIDFNANNGLSFNNINTIWNEPFVDFHHSLLEDAFPSSQKYLFDASDWFKRNSGSAEKYYIKYVSLFILHGILFENFVVEGEDFEFTKHVFLPSFFHTWRKFGKKPLIVALMPTAIEGDLFWVSHPDETVTHIDKKLNQ